MINTITSALHHLEATASIRILLAVESGSRAWGFPSPDSDYDVRLVYCHPPTWYLSLDEGRDTIEQPMSDLLDLSGWELRKFLRLLRAGNATPAEWLQSPIVYQEMSGAAPALQGLLQETFHARPILHHYLGMVRRGVEEDLAGETVRLKRFFYALRAGLAARWIRLRATTPPLTLADLRVLLPHELATDVDELLSLKLISNEDRTVPRPTALTEFLADEYAAGRVAQADPAALPRQPAIPNLNQTFQELIRAAFPAAPL